MIKVSIIIPIYNAENFLETCLESVLKQTVTDFEIICIDDGSMDHSSDILLRFSVKDKRIRVFSQINKGAGEARNLGIREARGEFVAFMDVDDYYPENSTLEKLYNLAVEYQVMIAGGSLSAENVKFKKGDFHRFDTSGVMSYGDYPFDFGFQRFIYNRQMLLDNNIFFPSLRVFEDPVFFVSAMVQAQRFYAFEDVTYCYSGPHNTEFNLEKTQDLLKGLTENLKKSSQYQLGKLHQLTVDRLQKTGSYYVEKFLDQRQIFCGLLKAYAAIDFSLLKQTDSQYDETYIVEPLELIWKVYVKYNLLRNNNPFKLLRKLKS